MAKQFERFDLKPRKRARNTINGVPVDILDGHLPPPEPCPDCRYPTWMLVAPDTVTTTGVPRPAIYRAEYEPHPEWKCEAQQLDKCRIHPYHLRPHRGDLCRPDRLVPVLPARLIVRPPRIGEING